MKSTPNRIKARRQELGLTLRQLASRLGTTKDRVHRIETGATSLRIDDLAAWAKALKTTPAELLP